VLYGIFGAIRVEWFLRVTEVRLSFTAVTMPAMSIAAREETLRYSEPTQKPTKQLT
jgi:hypothetical protein